MSDFDPIKAGAILVEDEPFDPIKVGAVLIDDEPFDPIKVGAIEVDGALSELETKAGMALKWAQEQSNGLLDNRLTPYHHLQKNRSPYGADADAVATRLMRDNLRAEVRKLNPEMTEAGIDTELARGTGLMDWVGGAFKTLGKTGAQSLAYGAELGGFMLESGAEYMRKLMRGLAGIPATDYAARAQKRETYRRETRDYYVNKLGRSEEEAGRLTNQLVDKFFPEQRANVKEAYDLAYRYRRQTEQQPWATDDPHTPNVVKTVSSAIAQGIPQLLSLVSYKIPGLGPMVALKDVLSESYNQLRTDSEQSGKNLSEDELIDAAMSSAAFKALFEVGMDKFALKGISGLFGKKASGAVTAELAKETAKKEAQKGFVRRAAEAYLKQQAVEQPTELIQDYSDKFFGARLGLEQDWYSWAELRDRTLSVAFMPQGAVAAVGEARARQNNLPLTAEALKQQHQQFQEKIRAATNGFYRGEDTVDQAAKKMRQAGFSDTDIQIWRNRLTTPALAVNSDGGMRQQDSQPLYGADGKINSDAALTIAGIDFSNGLITLDEATAVNERFQGKELAEEFRKIMLPYVNEQGYYDQKGRERAAADAVGAEIEGENNPGAPTVTADGEQPSAPDNPVPESDATVAVQMDWLNKGKRDAVFFTPGTTIPATPEGLARLDTARGTFIYNPLVHSEESLNNAVKNDTLGDVLGYGIPRKPSDANIAGVIVLRGTDGTEKLSVVTDDAHRQQVEDNLNALAEEGDTVTLEPTEDKVLAERREQLSRQFPGVDWRNKPVPATPQKSSPASGNFQTAWEKTARLLTPIGGTVRRVNAPAKSSGFEAWFTLDEHGHPQVYVGVDEAMVNSHRQKFQNEEEFNEWVNRAFNEEYLHAADLESLRRKWEAGGSAGGFHEFLNHERAKLWRGLSEADRRMIEAIYGDFDPKATDAQKAQELLRILLQLQRDGKLTEFAGRLSAPGRSALRAWLQQLADFIKNTLRAANNTELQTALDEINAVLAEVDAALKEQSPTTNSESNITVSGEEINAVGDAPFAAAPHGGESVAKLERVRNAVRAVAEGAEEGVARNLRPDLVIYGGSADVVFPWGNDRFGLKKIATRRGAEVLNQVLRTVALGEVERHGDTKKTVNLALGDYRAVLSLDEHGKQKTWLLTGWEEGRPDATGEVSAQTEATQPTPTFSRDRLGAGLNDIIDTERRSVNSKSTAAGDAPFAAAPERRLPSRAVDGSISRMSDPARVAQDNRTSFPVGEQNEATRKAANGQPSNLTAAEYARATSPEFKARYGDWEALAKINAVRNSEPLKVNALATAPSEREVKNLFSTFGEIKNDKDGRQVIFPNRTVGKILRHRGFNVGRIAKDLPVIFRRTIPAWSENYQAKPGHKDHSSNIKAYHNYVGKFADGEATYFIRFTLHEENKHRGDGKNNLHSTFISDVEIYRQKQGADFARVHVSNMGVVKGAPYDEKLSRWLSSVNPQNIKIPLDENGEPVMSAIDQSHPNATRPNGGTPLFAAAPERRLPRRNENGSISRMSDPQRAANQHNRTSPAGGLSEAAPRLAANGQTSNLTAAEYARATSPEFKTHYGDWETLADLSFGREKVSAEQAKNTLTELTGRDLTNLETGLVARINRTQRGKILSLTALEKSQQNGFTNHQHNAAAARIDKLWKHAVQIGSSQDKSGDVNISAIKRFVAPVVFNGEPSVAYLTAKESVEHGHRLYSLELTDIKKLRNKGNTPFGDTASGAFNKKIDRLLEKVNPQNIKISLDENGEPVMSAVDQSRPNATRPNGGTPLFAAAPERRLPRRNENGSISRMSDPQRAATQHNRTSPAGGFSEARRAVNGQPSNLTAAEYARATSPEFKARYGDWEALAKRQILSEMQPLIVSSSSLGKVGSKEFIAAAKAVYRQFRSATNHGKTIQFVMSGFRKLKSHSADSKTLRIIPGLKKLLETAVRLYSQPDRDGNPNIVAWHTYAARAVLDGEPVLVKMVVREELNGHLLLDFFDDSTVTTEKAVRTPAFNAGPADLSKDKLHQWWHSVNSQDIKISLDENGEPVLSAIDQARPNATRPNGGTPLFAAAPERRLPSADADGNIDGMSDPQRAANQHNRTSPAGGLSEAAPRLAANGQTSNLTAAEYARATSPEFKARYGDWEALAKQRQFEALIDEALSGKDTRGKIILRKVTPEERAEILRQRGPDVAGLSHEITAEELRHAFNTHGQSDEASRQPNQRPLTRADLTMIPAVIDAPDEITVQPRGSNRTSIIYGRDFGNGKIEYVERVFETSQKNKPRLTTRSVWVRRATTGVKSSPTRVSTPYRNSNLPFANGRVNPDSIKIPLDKNGEPVMSQVTADADQSRPNAARPNGGTPLFAAAPYNPVKGLSDAEPTRFANATVVPPALFAAAPERRSSAEVGERWLNVARNPDSRRFGDLADREIFDTATGEVEVGKAKDIRTILREIDEEIADETIIRRETIEEDIDNPDENGKPGTTEVISFYNKSNPTSRIRVNNPDSHFVSVNSYYNEGRTATPIYQAIYAWAHNNGKVVVPDHTTTPDGLFRRNSQMLNSALRFGTTDHMRPNPETGLDWRRGEHAHNIGEMAKREAQFVSELFNGLFDGWRYDANRDTFYDDSGTAIQPAQIKARITGAIHARYPESIRWPKAGEATVRRALASREFQAMASSQSVREHATPLERPGVPESVRPPVPGAIPQGLDGRESQNTQSGLGGIEEHDSRGGLNEALYAASPERSDSNPLPSAHNLTEGVDEAELRRLLTASGGQQQGGVSPLLHGIHGLGQATDPNANAAPFDPAKQGMPPLTMRERNRTLIKGVGSAAKRLWDENTRLKKHSELQIIMAGNFQVVNAEARGTAADLIKQVKEVEAREGINAYIEAGGDLAKLKAWEEQSKGELLKRGYRAAQHLTDEQKQIAAQVSHYFKVLAQREKQWGINVNELENYVTHIWQRPSAVGAIGGGARGLSMALKYAKQRTYDTFFDGEQAGLKPVTKDIAEILATRIAASGQAILARKFVKEMSAGVAADGRWLTSVRGNFTQVVKPGDQPKGAVYLSNPRFQDKQTEDYKTLDIAALRQWKWLGKTADGTAVLGNNDIILHPDAYALMKTAFGGNWVKNLYTVQAGDSATKAALKTLTGFIKDDIFAGGKATLFSGLIPSTFHIVHQGYHAGVYEQVNPFLIFNSIVINPYQDAAQADAVRHGLMLVEDRSNQDFTRGARNSARAWDARVMNHVAKWLRDQGNLPADVAAWTLEKLRALPEAFHEMLFTSYIPKLKWLTYQKRLELYRKLYAKELADGTASLDDIKFMAASHANAAYGGLNTFFVDKGLLELASTTMLAPDYFFARRAYNLKGALGAASAIGGDHKANAHAFYSFVLMSGAVYLATRALNYALSSMRGADDDDDDPWKIKDIRHAFALVIGNRSYDVRSEAQDLITMLFGQQDGVLSSVATFMHGRISPLSRLVIESMTKRNYRGEDLPQSEVWLNFLQQSIPMPLQGFLQVSQTQQDATKTAWQQLAGAMGLQVKRISPRNDLYTLAAEWRADHAKEYGIAARQPKLPTSKYTPMRYALEDGDLDRARAEFDNCWRGWARRAARAARTWWTVSKNPSMPPSPTISATARRRTRRSWIR